MGEEFKSDSVETSALLLQSSSKGKKLQYVEGHWLNSILHPREFYEEIPFIPLEIRYGAGFYGSGSGSTEMKSGWIEYENNAIEEFDGGSINTRIGHQLELDILKTNLSYFLFKTSWADIHTGLNLRYSSLFSPEAIPDTSWGDVKPSWDTGSRSFSPQLFEFGLSNSVNLQWYDSWLINLRYVYGLASGKFYRTGNLYDDTPSGWGPSSAYSAGFRYVLNQDAENQFLLGVDFRYSSTEINRISDPNDVTPISKFNLSNYGVLFSLTVFKGGKSTIGSLGKEYYYHRDYVLAKEHLEEFVIQYPRHSNLHRAEKYIEECRRKIPHQLVKEGMSFDERKLTEKALAKYREARNLTLDENLVKSLDDRISQIAQKNMRNAENMMSHGESDSALEAIVRTAVYSKEAQESIPRFRGKAYLNEGEKAKNAGFYLKALEFFEKALAQDRDLKIEVDYLRYEIATLLVHQANRAEDLSAIQLVIQSLEDDHSPGAGDPWRANGDCS